MLEAESGASGALISLHIGDLSLTLIVMSQEIASGIMCGRLGFSNPAFDTQHGTH